MINYLKGTIVSKIENSPSGCNVTIEVNNIGYLVETNVSILNRLPLVGEIATVYTSLIHKEDAMYLCGFETREQRDLFNILRTVSGIGTKVAMLLLDEFSPQEIVSNVVAGEHKALSRTKGIGPKLAQKIVLELKDKMTKWRDKITIEMIETPEIIDKNVKENYLEAESVILSLGYSKQEAKLGLDYALKTTDNQFDSEELLRLALSWLAQG